MLRRSLFQVARNTKLSGLNSNRAASDAVNAVFQKMNDVLKTDGETLCSRVNAQYRIELKDTKETFFIDLKNSPGLAGEGEKDADVKLTMKEQHFIDLIDGKLKAQAAFMTGKLKMKGDMGKALALDKLIKKVSS